MSSVTTAPRLDRATMRRNLDGFKHRWNERLDGWRSLDELKFLAGYEENNACGTTQTQKAKV